MVSKKNMFSELGFGDYFNELAVFKYLISSLKY